MDIKKFINLLAPEDRESASQALGTPRLGCTITLLTRESQIKGDCYQWYCTMRGYPSGLLTEGYVQASGDGNVVMTETFEVKD